MTQQRDLTSSAKIATISTVLFVLTQFAYSAFLFWDNSVYAAYLANENGAAEIAALDRLDTLFLPMSIGFVVVLIASYICGGRWIYLASNNAAHMVPSPERITPGWAVGWYFVPIANLWMPFKAMKQIWAASVGGRKLESEVPLWVTCWWVTWIGLGIMDQITSNIGTSISATPEEYMAGNFYVALSGFIWIIPSALFIRIIKEVTAAQASPAEVFA